MFQNALILFLKYPARSTVKTRLASVLGDHLTLGLYRAFLADLADLAQQVDAQTLVVYAGPSQATFPEFPLSPCLPQHGKDIGERMFNAFKDAFAMGHERAALIGSDLPDLPAGQINAAFDKLNSADVVLGPCTDGGYYLVACNPQSIRRSLFADIAWSTASVFSATMERIRSAGLTCASLETCSDIDDHEDLKQFYRRNQNGASPPSHTMRFLRQTHLSHTVHS